MRYFQKISTSASSKKQEPQKKLVKIDDESTKEIEYENWMNLGKPAKKQTKHRSVGSILNKQVKCLN